MARTAHEQEHDEFEGGRLAEAPTSAMPAGLSIGAALAAFGSGLEPLAAAQ